MRLKLHLPSRHCYLFFAGYCPASVAQSPGGNWGFDLSSAAPPVSSERITGGGGSGGSAAAAAALMPISSIGQMTRTTPAQPTGRQSNPMSYSRSLPQPPQTMLSTLSNHGGRLLPTTMDSFVMDAAGMAELIYGDEGDESIPPYFGFTEEHRINAGINSQNLTTGHASSLPEAWGYPQ